MNKIKQLETALEWALKEGMIASGVNLRIRTAGCDCCSYIVYDSKGTNDIPDEICAVVLKAARKVTKNDNK